LQLLLIRKEPASTVLGIVEEEIAISNGLKVGGQIYLLVRQAQVLGLDGF